MAVRNLTPKSSSWYTVFTQNKGLQREVPPLCHELVEMRAPAIPIPKAVAVHDKTKPRRSTPTTTLNSRNHEHGGRTPLTLRVGSSPHFSSYLAPGA